VTSVAVAASELASDAAAAAECPDTLFAGSAVLMDRPSCTQAAAESSSRKKTKKTGVAKKLKDAPKVSGSKSRWNLLKVQTMRIEALRHAVRSMVTELLESSYCELVALTPVDAKDAVAEACEYLKYIDTIKIMSAHSGSDSETAAVLETVVAAPRREYPSGLCVHSHEVVLVDNALADKRFDTSMQRKLGLSAISQLHVPLLAPRRGGGHMCVGVLSLINRVTSSGRAGVPFDGPTDAQHARAVAAAIIDLRARSLKADVVKGLCDRRRASLSRSASDSLSSASDSLSSVHEVTAHVLMSARAMHRPSSAEQRKVVRVSPVAVDASGLDRASAPSSRDTSLRL